MYCNLCGPWTNSHYFFLTATSYIDDGKILCYYAIPDLGVFKLIYLISPSLIYINLIYTYRREYLYCCVVYYSLRIILENLLLNISADRRNIREDIATREVFKVALTDCITIVNHHGDKSFGKFSKIIYYELSISINIQPEFV